MNKRQINLDFTSLLDIIMVILFFFIIFGKLQTGKIEEREKNVSEQEKKVSTQIAEAEIMYDNAAKKEKEAQEKLDEAEAAEERSGENADALADLNHNKNLKAYLNMVDNSEWILKLYCDDECISDINKTGYVSVANSIKSTIGDIGISTDDSVIIEMIYDSSQPGTNKASKLLNQAFDELRKDYKHLFLSEIDSSKLVESET